MRLASYVIDPRIAIIVWAGNQAGWGPESAASNGFKLSALKPTAPAAPILEAVDSTSMRVHFTMPPVRPGAPAHEAVTIFISADNGAWKPVDSVSGTLQEGQSYTARLSVAVVKGLSENVSYRARLSVWNACGWGAKSAASESLELPMSAVLITGGRTREERDAELRKRAVDVETESAASSRAVSRLPKKVKRE